MNHNNLLRRVSQPQASQQKNRCRARQSTEDRQHKDHVSRIRVAAERRLMARGSNASGEENMFTAAYGHGATRKNHRDCARAAVRRYPMA